MIKGQLRAFGLDSRSQGASEEGATYLVEQIPTYLGKVPSFLMDGSSQRSEA